MKLTNLRINHIATPLGFNLQGKPLLSFQVIESLGEREVSVSIKVALDSEYKKIVFNSGIIEDIQTMYSLDFTLSSRTKYFVHIIVQSNLNERAEETTWFETGKMDEPWSASWIGSKTNKIRVPRIYKNLKIDGDVESIRAYVACAGLYAVSINGIKAGNEYLTPYCNDYSSWMQVITHDLTDYFKQGDNSFEFTLSNGWYKGSFTYARVENIYGDQLAVLSEIHIKYKDGRNEIINTDDTWLISDSVYDLAEIYDGVEINYRKTINQIHNSESILIDYAKLQDRLSLPVKVMENRRAKSIFMTPNGEMCLDFGQNMVGWVSVDTSFFTSRDFQLQYFEVLDSNGNVYIENLRTAKASFTYLSDNKVRIVEPEFSYYGFRYVQIKGLDDVSKDAFIAKVVYSEMSQVGYIETSNEPLNKLFQNALWSQKGNFVDVPTDCPQRDERLGWTGDAQVFCGTALFNMDSSAFYNKYLYDLQCEQNKLNGGVPVVVPSFATGYPANDVFKASVAGWGDAATIIPWTSYLHTGDKYALKRHYPIMKNWVNYIRSHASENNLWERDFQLGDWLALDNPNHESMFGITPSILVASAFYLYSTEITKLAAEILDYDEDKQEFENLAGKIRKSLKNEFVTASGRIASDTQTADVLALMMEFYSDLSKTVTSLETKIQSNNGHLNTGFVGTSYLCKVLSNNGANDLAYKLLLNKDYPGWLYQVEKGATTIWERWNSIHPDGKFNDSGMNSLNHYAYGSIIEWIYRFAAGIQPLHKGAGFRAIQYAPQPNPRLKWLKVSYNSACGKYSSEWQINLDSLKFKLEVPFNGCAELKLPDTPNQININGKPILYKNGMRLNKGVYEIDYIPTKAYYINYNLQTTIDLILDHPKLVEIVSTLIPEFRSISPIILLQFKGSLIELLHVSKIKITHDVELQLIDLFSKIRSWDR